MWEGSSPFPCFSTIYTRPSSSLSLPSKPGSHRCLRIAFMSDGQTVLGAFVELDRKSVV